MRSVLALTLCAAVALLSTPGHAEIKGNMPKASQQSGLKILTPYVEQFGYTPANLAYAEEKPPALVYEFVPEGATKQNWTGMITATIFPFDKTAAETKAFINTFVANMAKAPGLKMIETARTETPLGPVVYANFEITSGNYKEHNLSLTWPQDVGITTNFQVQSRTKDPSEAAVKRMKSIYLKVGSSLNNSNNKR